MIGFDKNPSPKARESTFSHGITFFESLSVVFVTFGGFCHSWWSWCLSTLEGGGPHGRQHC